MTMIAVAGICTLQYQGKKGELRDGRNRAYIWRGVIPMVSIVSVIIGTFVKLT